MSRIHDALLRAEQERSSGISTAPEAPAIAVAEADSGAVALPAAARPEPMPAAPSPAASEQLTYELLQSRCALRSWNFAPGRKLSDANGPVPGLEELRTLRTRMYQLRGAAPLKIVLIASSLPQEGKTFLSCMLSQVFARQQNRRALLIDGDLRIPRQHTEFGAPASPGLSDYLKGHADEFAIMQRGPVERLMLIPGGTVLPNPAELLAGNGLQRLLNRVAPCFDWVFIDSPAVIPIADASSLANVCDGVLMVVRAGQTPYDLAQKARNEFRHKRVLGAVINGIDPHSTYGSHYYSHYGYNAPGKQESAGS